MRAKHIRACSTVIAGMLVAAPAVGAGKEPAVAVFGSYEYVESATGSDCTVPTGTYFNGRLSWPGPGRTGAVWRYQENGPGGPQVKQNTYPKTPVAGSSKWAGTVKTVINPGGTTGTSTVDATLTYIDANDFVLERTNRYGNCTETIFSSLVRD